MGQSRREKIWGSGVPYESYVGRWSRLVAHEFLNWLAIPAGSRWLDVGCGTGALSEIILDVSSPTVVRGVDPSVGYVTYAREQVRDRRARFEMGDARALPYGTAVYDAVVAGLVLNFVPSVEMSMVEMVRVVRGSGCVAGYVWDYAGQMQLMRHFWDAAVALNPAAFRLDEGRRFPICQPGPLAELFRDAGLQKVEVRPIDIPTRFRDFDDYWSPFLGGQFPAPDYAMSLSEEHRNALRERIRASLPIGPDGSIHLIARAWAVRGVRASEGKG
ncbi:MAG: methyltransferase domain-containing protein [Candidatus Methylomirabilales bacterium]